MTNKSKGMCIMSSNLLSPVLYRNWVASQFTLTIYFARIHNLPKLIVIISTGNLQSSGVLISDGRSFTCFGITLNGFRSLAHISAVRSALLLGISFDEVPAISLSVSSSRSFRFLKVFVISPKVAVSSHRWSTFWRSFFIKKN